jgi:hypothetical protein
MTKARRTKTSATASTMTEIDCAVAREPDETSTGKVSVETAWARRTEGKSEAIILLDV